MRIRSLVLPVLCLALAACGIGGCAATTAPPPQVLTPPTPVQVYNAVDAGRAVFLSSAGLLHASGRISDAEWAAIQQADTVTVKAQADALAWMQANPVLANTPGAQVPGYSPASLLNDAFGVFAKKYGIVLPQPITIVVPASPKPTTQPG